MNRPLDLFLIHRPLDPFRVRFWTLVLVGCVSFWAGVGWLVWRLA